MHENEKRRKKYAKFKKNNTTLVATFFIIKQKFVVQNDNLFTNESHETMYQVILNVVKVMRTKNFKNVEIRNVHSNTFSKNVKKS